jgi:uncharacterized protein with HEPN domain
MARDVAVVLQEILDAISLIEEAAAGHDLTRFSADRFLQRGTERLLEIISEAVRHLPDDLLATRKDVDWHGIRAIGNLMRHEYYRIDPDIVWSVVNDDLPPLRIVIEGFLPRQG